MSGLSLDWTKHLSDAEKRKSLEETIRNSTVALGRLKEILEERQRRQDTTREADYESPSWSHKQADSNGYRRCLTDILDLLKFLDRRR